MEKTLKQAVEANNIPAIREALVDIIVKDSGKTVPIQTVTKVLETTPGLFDVDNGKKYADSPADMTDELVAQLIEDLKSNFSIEKFSLLAETFALDPDRKVKVEKTSSAASPEVSDGMQAVSLAEEIDPVTDEEREQMLEDAKATFGAPDAPKGGSRIVAAIIMILGCAAAIVGLCVPVKFLLGLGIGVFMLGTALLYININDRGRVVAE